MYARHGRAGLSLRMLHTQRRRPGVSFQGWALPRREFRTSRRRSMTFVSDDGHEAKARDGSLLLAISNEMVRIFKDQFGRGPTKVRSSFAGPDVLTVVLEDTLTPAERNLAKM